jgi:hypothetical protein
MNRALWAGILAAGLLGGLSVAQDEAPKKPEKPQDRFRPEPEPGEEKELTTEEAMQILRDCQRLMTQAEDLLNDSSRGKALETEKELIEKIDKLLKEDSKENPAASQQKVLEKIQKLMKKSEKSQGDTVDKLGDVIRRAKAQQGQGQGQPQPHPGQKQPQQQAQRAQQPGNPAPAPYDPNRNGDPVNKFRSRGDRTGRWGDLPPRLREAMLSGKRDLDDYPPEFQQVLKEYMKKLAEENEK